MNWHTMGDEQRKMTLRAMGRFGGGFVQALAQAWQRADALQAGKLADAFPDLVEKYGPNGPFLRRGGQS